MDMFNFLGAIYIVVVLAAAVGLAWLVIAAIRALNAYTDGQRTRTALFLAETAIGDDGAPNRASVG